MEIDYEDKNVEKLFTNYPKMRKEKGMEITKILIKRVAEIKASESLDIYLKNAPGKPHFLEGNKKGLVSVNVDKHKRLILKPILSENLEHLKAIKECKKIIVNGVEDYHGGKTTTYIP